MKLRTMLEYLAAVGQEGSSVLQRLFRQQRHIDSLLCCRHNMKLRTMLEHEAGGPPPVWAAAAGCSGGLSDSLDRFPTFTLTTPGCAAGTT